VTYEQDKLAHTKTEFGFDVLEVARRTICARQLSRFIGFEVAQGLLERAFQETYGLDLKSVLVDEEKALNSYRHAFSKLLPKATRIAWALEERRNQRRFAPEITKRKFSLQFEAFEFRKRMGQGLQETQSGRAVFGIPLFAAPEMGTAESVAVPNSDAGNRAIF